MDLKTMRKIIRMSVSLCLCLVFMLCAGAQAGVEQNVLLDSAFRFLDEGNIFIERYHQITGADVSVLFPTGLPYFFGGKHFEDVMANYPQFSKRTCMENTTFYRKGKQYIYGLDCHGYISALRTEAGYSEIPPLNDLYKPTLTDKKKVKYDFGQYYIWCKYAKGAKNPDIPMPETVDIHKEAQVGDLMLIHAKGNHILMYIGTLRDYGFTEEEVPALKDYMDYPLMIHCGVSPVYGERIQQVLDADREYFKKTKTTNGGVQVSIWGVPREAAEVHETVQKTDFDYFYLPNGQVMTIYDLKGVSKWRWMRLPEEVPIPND